MSPQPIKLGFEPQERQLEAFNTRATEVLFGGAAGGGKALAVETLIPTPSGLSTMGELKAGDEVFSEDGSVARVLVAHEPVLSEDVYRLTFDDGSSVVANGEHLWKTMTVPEREKALRRTDEYRKRRRQTRESRVAGNRTKAQSDAIRAANSLRCHETKAPPGGRERSTGEIARTLRVRNRKNHSVEMCRAVEAERSELLVDPYLVGVFLGDGTGANGTITTVDEEIVEFISERYELLSFQGKTGECKTYSFAGLMADLRTLGLIRNKHVPDDYLWSSVDQRKRLMAGLVDTDGHVDDRGRIEFTNTSGRLVWAFYQLACSLGEKLSEPREHRSSLNGKDCGRYWRIVYTPAVELPLLVRRKRRRLRTRARQPKRYVASCEKIEPRLVRCITVDHSSGMFLCGRNFIPTHNSWLLRVATIKWCCEIPGLQAYLFRRSYKELIKNHFSCDDSYGDMLAPLINAGKANIVLSGPQKRVEFWNGSKIHLCHCYRSADKNDYEGSEIHVLAIDELGHFEGGLYKYLRSRVRMSQKTQARLPEKYKGMFPRILACSNPIGIGFDFMKATWINSAPPYEIWRAEKKDGGMLRQFIPSRLEDNKYIDTEEYEGQLFGTGNEARAKALRWGDWTVASGSRFGDFWDPDVHEIYPFEIPRGWHVDRSLDWGDAKPFSVGWWAESDGSEIEVDSDYRSLEFLPHVMRGGTPFLQFPRGTLFRIYEWYGWTGEPDVGLRMPPADVARGILEREERLNLRVSEGPADSAIWDTPAGSTSIIEAFETQGVHWTQSVKYNGSRSAGWTMLAARLMASTKRPMEDPGIFFFNHCRQSSRILPSIAANENNIDDLAKRSEDHLPDDVRYRLLSDTRTFSIESSGWL